MTTENILKHKIHYNVFDLKWQYNESLEEYNAESFYGTFFINKSDIPNEFGLSCQYYDDEVIKEEEVLAPKTIEKCKEAAYNLHYDNCIEYRTFLDKFVTTDIYHIELFK